MKLIPCKACGHKISKKAPTCPNCGNPSRKRKGKGGCLKTFFFVGVLFVVLYVLIKAPAPRTPHRAKSQDSALSAGESSQEPHKRVEEALRSEFTVKTKRAVRESFKDPDSVQFRDVQYGESKDTGRVIYGHVNAKNSFGAYTGFVRFISNGKDILLENKAARFDDAWLAIQNAKITENTLQHISKGDSEVPVIIDLKSLVGKSPSTVAKILGEASEKTNTQDGPKFTYQNGKYEIVYIKGKADWITINQIQELTFHPDVIKAFGFTPTAPDFANDGIFRWEKLQNIKSFSVFSDTKGKCDYAYLRATTK